MFLSKGKLIKKYSKNSIVVQKHGGRYELKDKKAHIWLQAREEFYIPKDVNEEIAVIQLWKEGLMAKADTARSFCEYYLLTDNILCVNWKRGGMPLRGTEKEIMQWFKDGRRRLRMEELVYLIENRINPSDYEKDEFGVALSERIYHSRIQVENVLRREMSYAKRRDEVVNAILRLFGKNRMYML